MLAHRALSIADVVCLILHEVKNDKTTLAHVARCCQTFHEPSLDILWRDLRSFIPLRNLLPGLMDDRAQGAHAQTIVSVTATPQASILTLFHSNVQMNRL